jgi:hypothetical protein
MRNGAGFLSFRYCGNQLISTRSVAAGSLSRTRIACGEQRPRDQGRRGWNGAFGRDKTR